MKLFGVRPCHVVLPSVAVDVLSASEYSLYPMDAEKPLGHEEMIVLYVAINTLSESHLLHVQDHTKQWRNVVMQLLKVRRVVRYEGAVFQAVDTAARDLLALKDHQEISREVRQEVNDALIQLVRDLLEMWSRRVPKQTGLTTCFAEKTFASVLPTQTRMTGYVSGE